MKKILDAPITSIGVYSYQMPDGTTRRDLRRPEDVFSWESLETLRGVPVTLDHPSNEQLAANDYEIYGAVISASQGFELSQMTNIVGQLNVFKEVPNLENKFLSAGYTCEVDLTPGQWCGINYDAVQKNIKYNHVALVDAARAGETTSLKEAHMDSANGQIATQVQPGATAPAATTEAPKPSVETKADGAQTQVNPAPQAPATPTVDTPKTTEAKADAAPAQPAVTAPAAPAPTPAPAEVKKDSADFVTKADFDQLVGLVKGLGETISKLVPAPTTTTEVKADSADPAPSAPKPVVEVKMDSAQPKDDDGRKAFEDMFFNQGGKK